jgi:hypothetical protein
MKIALNNRNVILQRYGIGAADCYRCCFLQNLDLCGILELRDYTICRTTKVFDDTELKGVFKL